MFEGMFEEKEILEQSISARIRYQMQKAKISQSKLAKAVGLTRDRIYVYENGKIAEENMDIEILKRLAKYFGIDQYYFCNEYHVFMDTMDVPELLKRIREKSGLTQREFAKKKGIPLSAYKVYESGRVRLQEKYWKKLQKELKEGADV